MNQFSFLRGQLNWWQGGIALALAFLLAVMLVKPIGVSTQFVIADGLVAELFTDLVQVSENSKSGYTSSNAYLAKSDGKYAAAVAEPINYGFIFVLAMIAGAALSARTAGPQKHVGDSIAPAVWRNRFGDKAATRYIASFVAGVLVLFGARLAGGCTSGHMMSGMMQTSLSGYLFAIAAFTAAIPVAILLYRRA